MKFRDTAFREYLPVSREIVIVNLVRDNIVKWTMHNL